MRRNQRGFTLIEMLVAIAVLTILIVIVSTLFTSASNVTSTGTKRMDIDSELRPVFNRIAVDLAKMVKRSDVAAHAKTQGSTQTGNDLIAFYSLVDGFFPTSNTAEKRQPQTTLVSYRINPSFRFERMAKGLAFAGQHPSPPLLFGTANTIAANWSTATSSNAPDADYSVVAAGVFRFEYYYILKSTGAASEAPWPAIPQINVTDIGALAVNIAVIDPRSRALVTDSAIADLVGRMTDYEQAMGTTGLIEAWQTTIDGTTNIPRVALQNIRLYQRIFTL